LTALKRKFFVYIVESPGDRDIYVKRSEGEMLLQALSLLGIPATHRIPVNLVSFSVSVTLDLQKYLKEQVDELLPIIHISAHGNRNGIQLTDGLLVSWDKLRDLLMPLNKLLDGRLLLCMSSCGGSNACIMAMSEDEVGETPFGAVVGHTGETTYSNTAIAYATFYHLLAKGYSIKKAVEAMKIASGDFDFTVIGGKEAQQSFIKELGKRKMEALIRDLLNDVSDEVLESPLAKVLT